MNEIMDLTDLSPLVRGCAVSPGVGSLDAPRDLGFDSAVEAETGLFLYALALRLHSKVIVETGTNHGYSTAFLAMALKHLNQWDSQSRGVWTVDKQDVVRRDLWATLGVEDLIHFTMQDSLAWSPDLPGPIDLLWLDAGHEKDEVAGEFTRFLPRTRPGTIVVIHDTITNPGVLEALRVIRLQHRADIAGEMWISNLRGLALISIR